jgi:predicted phosphoribosyltransferase
MNGEILFRDRRAAGRALAGRLQTMQFESPLVIALPRGGVPVGYEVATALGAPLDIGIVRKIGVPGEPEFGVGALGEDGQVVLDEDAMRVLGLQRADLDPVIAAERAELERRRTRYRDHGQPLDVRGRDVIVVDDGIATGVTMTAAVHVLRARGARRIVVAVPVCPQAARESFAESIDDFVTLATPRYFGSVGAWYADFAATSDEEVLAYLRLRREELARGAAAAREPA